jgi:hypothetical protein
MRERDEPPNTYEEWMEEEEEDSFTKNRNSDTIEDLIDNLIKRDKSTETNTADKELDVQFYSIILPIFFYFFVSSFSSCYFLTIIDIISFNCAFCILLYMILSCADSLFDPSFNLSSDT